MEQMDERTKLEYWKINNEIFLFSAIFPIILLIIKLALKVDVLGMLGEIAVLANIFLYFIVQLIYILKNGVIDERVKQKTYKLSTVFYMSGVVLLAIFGVIGNLMQKEEANILTHTPYLLLTIMYGFSMFYRIIRTSNEKFMSQKSVNMPYNDYKRKITMYAIIGTVFLVSLIAIIAILTVSTINDATQNAYPLSKSWLTTNIAYASMFLLGVPCCWITYYKSLKAKNSLEKTLT